MIEPRRRASKKLAEWPAPAPDWPIGE